uniref:Putative acetyltransferase n=1 Tax=viral metagenome TaxID=1070528 RepID=A0A6H1Z9G7_9ZZZZ
MIILQYKVNEINWYASLYKKVFPDDPINYPSDVYVGYEQDKIVGFASGYPLDPNTWYLQRAGVIPEERGKTKIITWYINLLREMDKTWPAMLTLVENLNVKTLKLDMAMGFVIIGTRMDSGRNLWVELLRLREN